MSVMRNRPKGVSIASFGFALGVFALTPNDTGYQDIASLLARQPGVAERWQKRVYSAAASIQLATYSFGRPIGTATPQSATYRLAGLMSEQDIAGAVPRNPILVAPQRYQAVDFPKVDRTLKGDRLIVQPQAAPEEARPAQDKGPGLEDPSVSNASVPNMKTARVPSLPAAAAAAQRAPLDPELQAAMRAPPLTQYGVPLEAPPLDDAKAASDAAAIEPQALRDGFNIESASLFFGNTALGGTLESMERWQPGEEPTIVMPDPDMKLQGAAKAIESGESIAPKGEVNTDDQRAKTPVERLGLFDEKSRAREEKCLAEAVYFEARGEAVRGQIAVAQVVMNRAFSGKYPNTVCGVVYQNKHRHLACQFTFACEGKDLSKIDEPDMWEQAKSIAKDTLDGKIWHAEVGHATHYHAYWVHPSWVHEMTRLYKFGVHTFYRPRNWGDGEGDPVWGKSAPAAPSASTSETQPGKADTSKPDGAKAPQAAASPKDAKT